MPLSTGVILLRLMSPHETLTLIISFVIVSNQIMAVDGRNMNTLVMPTRDPLILI